MINCFDRSLYFGHIRDEIMLSFLSMCLREETKQELSRCDLVSWFRLYQSRHPRQYLYKRQDCVILHAVVSGGKDNHLQGLVIVAYISYFNYLVCMVAFLQSPCSGHDELCNQLLVKHTQYLTLFLIVQLFLFYFMQGFLQVP